MYYPKILKVKKNFAVKLWSMFTLWSNSLNSQASSNSVYITENVFAPMMKYETANSMKVSSNPAKVPCCTVIYDACSSKIGVCDNSFKNHFKWKKLLSVSGKELNPELYTITAFYPLMPCLFMLTACKLITTSPNQLHPTAHERIPLVCWQYRNIFLGSGVICEYTYVISPVHHVSAMLNFPVFRWIYHKQQEKGWGTFNYFTSD